EFEARQIKPGQTVLLANIPGNNELFLALQFIALTAFGVRVLLPMFMETNELDDWLQSTGCRAVIIPRDEINALNHHENEKSVLTRIERIVGEHRLPCFDNVTTFGMRRLIYQEISEYNYLDDKLIRRSMATTNPGTEALLISTSGTSGKSKLVTYEQGAYIRNCLAWQQAGLYDPSRLGGRGFTPLFTHTMGIRAFINALWTGTPVCLINTEWFQEKPEIVRYLLLKMKPEHITGGPAVYSLMLELMRNFPELKESMAKDFKALISSGAPLNQRTINEIESAFGIRMHNAYGTTETQQALNTLLLNHPSRAEMASLGEPLPGISIGLKRMEGEPGLYRMFIQASFGMKMPSNPDTSPEGPDGYFETGDVVEWREGKIYFVGRENKDFFKDGFGVKIPLNAIKKYYSSLYKISNHLSFFPVRSRPGLAALIFLDNDRLPDGEVADRETINRFRNLIGETNTRLFTSLEPFESRHRFISRFALVNSPVPTTVKGGVSQYKIDTTYHELIEQLTDPLSPDRCVTDVRSPVNIANTFTRHHNPLIGNLLQASGLDYAYHRSWKDSLFVWHDGREVEVLDLAGGYGINLIGHNRPEIKEVIRDFLERDEIALSDQGSIQRYAGMLGGELDLRVGEITGGSYYTIFGSTGAEAVEISLHHALFEWREELEKMEHTQLMQYGDQAGELLREVWDRNREILKKTRVGVIALKNGYHGHSAAARSLLGNRKKREAFINILALEPLFIDDEDAAWQEALEQIIRSNVVDLSRVEFADGDYVVRPFRHSSIIAAIAEPVIGEGGVRVANHDLLRLLSGHGFPLIMDEIQSGLGRTGTFLASEGLEADYYLFAKALGGGFEKISAVLINKNRYRTGFGEYYTATFANGGLAARVALETLTIIRKERIPETAASKGERIRQELEQVQRDYPEAIREITGTGLMQGIRLQDFAGSESIFLRILSEKELLGLLAASYLLNIHRVRILPTVSAPNMLRIEPSALITEEEINRFAAAIRDLADKIACRKIYDLFRPLMDGDPFADNRDKKAPNGYLYPRMDSPVPGARQVALVVHFAYPVEELRIFDPDICQASDTGLRILFNRMQVLLDLKPFWLFAKNICSGRIHLSVIALPVDVAELERLNRQGKREKVLFRIQDAVDRAAASGATVISLGGYTSILANNGALLTEPRNARLVTGNTLTAASGIRNLVTGIGREFGPNRKKKLAVVGAAGNIGSIVAEGLLKSGLNFDQVFLVGRNSLRLKTFWNDLEQEGIKGSGSRIHLTTNLGDIKQCNIIIAATNTNDPILFAHHFNSQEKIIISDLSIPGAISKEVKEMSNVVDLPFASFIHLPEDPGFVISSHTPAGSVFCCAAEAILCGLDSFDLPLKGRITMEAIEAIGLLAEKHHFFDQSVAGISFKSRF
ncbi:MAG: aminotransferase class III-fold pyridoxal phosphate-dependent enzyme, partial [Bacteroidales bacterium]